MSCIHKILELKGDKEFLRVPGHDIVIEHGGTYNNYDYLITFIQFGSRCGYVAIPPNHALNIKDHNIYSCPGFDVHGEVTFFGKSHISEALLPEFNCDDIWIGFDTAHAGDYLDYELSNKYFPENKRYYNRRFHPEFETIRSVEYMENECKKLIDQIC